MTDNRSDLKVVAILPDPNQNLYPAKISKSKIEKKFVLKNQISSTTLLTDRGR